MIAAVLLLGAAAADPPAVAASQPARVQVEGQVHTARLLSDGRRHELGPVPPGPYQLEIQLGRYRHWVRLDLGDLAATQEVVVACDPAFGLCVVRGAPESD